MVNEQRRIFDVTGYADNPQEVRDDLGVGLESIPGITHVSVVDVSEGVHLSEGIFMAGYIVRGNDPALDKARDFLEGQGYKVEGGGSSVKC